MLVRRAAIGFCSIVDELDELRDCLVQGNADKIVDRVKEVNEVGEAALELAQEGNRADENSTDLLPLRKTMSVIKNKPKEPGHTSIFCRSSCAIWPRICPS